MPIHWMGLVSRYELSHPEEIKPTQREKPPFAHVFKAGGPGYNPFRAKSGLFTSAGGGEPPGKGGKMLAAGQTNTGEKGGIAVGGGGSGGGNVKPGGSHRPLAKDTVAGTPKPDMTPAEVIAHVKNLTFQADAKAKPPAIHTPTSVYTSPTVAAQMGGPVPKGYDPLTGEPKSTMTAEQALAHIKPKPKAKPAVQHSPEVSAQVKKLKLPGGKGVQKAYGEHAGSYEWKQRGGYADSTMKRVQDAAEAAGYNELTSQTGGDATGNVVSHGRTFYNPDTGMELVIDSSYGVTKDDNYHSITLRKKKK